MGVCRMPPKHAKITDYEKQEDGSVLITTESYYDRRTQLMQEIQKNHLATPKSLEADVNTLIQKLIDGSSPKSDITITRRDNGGFKIIEKYVVLKKTF